jgi:hypothetical protein
MLLKVLKGRKSHLQVGGSLKLGKQIATSLTTQIYSMQQYQRSQHFNSRCLLTLWHFICCRLLHKICIVFQYDQIWLKQMLT